MSQIQSHFNFYKIYFLMRLTKTDNNSKVFNYHKNKIKYKYDRK